MDSLFLILTIVFIVASVAMILIILVQRPQGGGLAGAFGGAGGGGTEGVFGGRVGDALTVMTVCCFAVYLLLAIVLNADIWTPDSKPAEEPTLNEVLFPTAVGEPGFGDDEEPSASQPEDTAVVPDLATESATEPVEDVPVEETPVEEAPVEEAPVDVAPALTPSSNPQPEGEGN